MKDSTRNLVGVIVGTISALAIVLNTIYTQDKILETARDTYKREV